MAQADVRWSEMMLHSCNYLMELFAKILPLANQFGIYHYFPEHVTTTILINPL